jgi:hypothetical protein
MSTDENKPSYADCTKRFGTNITQRLNVRQRVTPTSNAGPMADSPTGTKT